MSETTTVESTVETDQAAREASGAHPYGRYLEEFEVGAVYKHWPAKTVTEADDHLFCLITMNHHPLHINDVYAAGSQQGRNVVVGPLVYSLALGMSVSDVSGKAIANLATEELKHPAPVFHGDTLFCESEVLEKRESQSKPDRGTVKVHTRVLNQDGVLVAEFKRLVLVPRKPGGGPPGSSFARSVLASCRHDRLTRLTALPQATRATSWRPPPPTPTDNKRLLSWVEEIAALTEPQEIHWCDGSAERVREPLPGACGRPAPSTSSPTPSAPTPTSRSRTPATWRASRTAPSSAPPTRPKPGPPTTGASPPRCAKRSTSSSKARCAGAPCTSCPSPWGRSARTRARSACSSPTPPTSPSACAS